MKGNFFTDPSVSTGNLHGLFASIFESPLTTTDGMLVAWGEGFLGLGV